MNRVKNAQNWFEIIATFRLQRQRLRRIPEHMERGGKRSATPLCIQPEEGLSQKKRRRPFALPTHPKRGCIQDAPIWIQHTAPSQRFRLPLSTSATYRIGDSWETVTYTVLGLCGLMAIGLCWI